MNRTKENGITLIALVITIIVLIILAGVTLSIVLGESGLIAKARKGAEDYQYAGLRERIEAEILALDMEKVVKGETLTIEDALIGLQANGTFEEIDIESNSGVCEGYVVELGYNADGKVVINGITKDTGVRIVATINPTGYTNGKVEVTISVKGNEKNVTNIEVTPEMTKKQGTEDIYEVEANGTYHVKATLEDGTTIEKDIVIATIDKLSPNAFEITAENTGSGIIITAETQDAEDGTNAKSGMDRYEYYIKKSTEADSAYQKYETNEIEGLEVGKYNVYVIAYDAVGNHTQSSTIEVEVKLKLKFQQIAAGSKHTVAIDIDGNLWAWGYNYSGQLGDGTTNDRTKPVKITIASEPNIKFQQIAAGSNHSLAIDTEGNLWTWGNNVYGMLGDGTTNDRTKPVKITIASEPNIKFQQVEAGENSSFAIDTEGNLWAWGNNVYGMLGDGTTNDRTKPVKVTEGVSTETKFIDITCAEQASMAVDINGNRWFRGRNESGMAGNGIMSSSVDKQHVIVNDIKFLQVKLNKYEISSHALGLDVNGNLWAWGYNHYGQLGDGTTTDKTKPVKITIDSEPNIKFQQIAAGDIHSLAIDSDGNLWAWGYNGSGRLGNGNTTQQNSPVQIKNGKKFKEIAAGYAHNLAIDVDGNLWAWGENDYGLLGDGTTQDKSTPTPIAQ